MFLTRIRWLLGVALLALLVISNTSVALAAPCVPNNLPHLWAMWAVGSPNIRATDINEQPIWMQEAVPDGIKPFKWYGGSRSIYELTAHVDGVWSYPTPDCFQEFGGSVGSQYYYATNSSGETIYFEHWKDTDQNGYPDLFLKRVEVPSLGPLFKVPVTMLGTTEPSHFVHIIPEWMLQVAPSERPTVAERAHTLYKINSKLYKQYVQLVTQGGSEN